MVILGLILVAAAIVVAVGVVLGNAGPGHLVVFDQNVPVVSNLWEVFLAGAAVAVVFVVGIMVMFTGLTRFIRTRRDLKDLRAEHRESLTTLEMEKQQLQRELARIRQNSGARPASSPAAARTAASSPAPAQTAASPAPRSQVSAASPFFDRD